MIYSGGLRPVTSAMEGPRMAVGVARCRPPVHAFASAEDPPGDLRVPVPSQLVVTAPGNVPSTIAPASLARRLCGDGAVGAEVNWSRGNALGPKGSSDNPQTLVAARHWV